MTTTPSADISEARTMALSPIEDILEDLRQGKVIVLVDDEDRENEGDFVCAAEHVDVELINFMTRIGGGYLCVAMTGSDCDRLDLAPQAPVNTSMRSTSFTVSVDGHPRHGISTGISASDRAKTIQLLVDENARPDDLVRPGHINPLRARDGGTLVRTGQTEGSVDLMRLAGLKPTAVIIEIVRPDGAMARMPDLEEICAEHDLKMCSVEQVIEHRLARETLVQRVAPLEGTPIETPYGPFTLYAYRSTIDPLPHIALVAGELKGADEATLVRVQRRDLLGDIFDAADRPTGRQLRACLRQLQDAECGVLVYLRPEHMGDGLLDQLQCIQRPDSDDPDRPDLTRTDGIGSSRPIEERELGTGSQILRDLGLGKLRVLANNERPYPGLHGYGLEIVEHVPITMSDDNRG